MSLTQIVTKAVDEVIHKFIQQLAIKYDLNFNELLSEWEGNSPTMVTNKISHPDNPSVTDIPRTDNEYVPNELLQYKKNELQALCRQHGLKSTGNKTQLIEYLLGKDSASVINKSSVKKKDEEVKNKNVISPVIKTLTSKIPTVAIRRNQFGNHEHPETSFVFNKKTKNVIGKQNDDGTIDDLTSEDIEICKKMKFQYTIPENLDKKINLDDVHVDELDEDEVLEEEEEEMEEEEEEEEELIEDEDFDNDDDFDEEFDDEEYDE